MPLLSILLCTFVEAEKVAAVFEELKHWVDPDAANVEANRQREMVVLEPMPEELPEESRGMSPK